jgi:hypothetical protein
MRIVPTITVPTEALADAYSATLRVILEGGAR